MNVTPTERAVWIAFGIAAAVYFIAFVIVMNAGYGDDTEIAAGWMAFGGTVAGFTLVPAILLTGMRQLLASRATQD